MEFSSESLSEENCPLEALRGSFFSRNSHKENLRDVLLEALGFFFRGLNWSFPFVVAPPFSSKLLLKMVREKR